MKPLLASTVAVALCLILILPCQAQDNIPKLINYQGKLTDAAGQALADGTYKLRFSLFSKKDSAQPGDSLVWGIDYNVTVVGGQFNAVLGAGGGTPVPGAAVNDIGFAFTGAERYVQLTVLTDNTGANLPAPQVLLPRQQLMSVPYALNGTPAGAILPYAGTVAPPGYLMCDGRSFNKADYPALAAVLNTATGAAFGGTAGANGTFNVPDLRGRFLRGTDDPDGAGTQFTSAGRDPDRNARSAMNSGGSSGNLVGSIQQDEFRSHTHIQNPHSHGHSLDNYDGYSGVLIQTGLFGRNYSNGNFGCGPGSFTIDSATATNQSTGGNETRPANAYCNYIIKF